MLTMTSDDLPDAIADQPPSVKLVYRELQTATEALTYDTLAQRCELGRRTVRRATSRLEDAGLVERCWLGTQTRGYRPTSKGGGGGQIDRQNGG